MQRYSSHENPDAQSASAVHSYEQYPFCVHCFFSVQSLLEKQRSDTQPWLASTAIVPKRIAAAVRRRLFVTVFIVRDGGSQGLHAEERTVTLFLRNSLQGLDNVVVGDRLG